MIWNDSKIQRHLSFGMMHGVAGGDNAGGPGDGTGGDVGSGGSESGGFGGGFSESGPGGGRGGGGGTAGLGGGRAGGSASDSLGGLGSFGSQADIDTATAMSDAFDNALGLDVTDSTGTFGGFSGESQSGFQSALSSLSVSVTTALDEAQTLSFGEFMSRNPAIADIGIAALSAINPAIGLVTSAAFSGLTQGAKAGAQTGLAGFATLALAPQISALSRSLGKVGFNTGGIVGATIGATAGKRGAEAAIDFGVASMIEGMDFDRDVDTSIEGVGEGREQSLLAGDGTIGQPSFSSRSSNDFNSFLAQSNPYEYYKEILDMVDGISEVG